MPTQDTATPVTAGADPAPPAPPPPRAAVSRSVRRRMVVRTVAPPTVAPPTVALADAAEPEPPEPPEPAEPPAARVPAGAAGADPRVEPGDRAEAGRTREDAGVREQRWRLAVAVLVVCLVAALIAAGAAGRSWYDQRQLDAAHQQALAAARQAAVNFVSISAATVDRDLGRISAGAAGDFADQFAQDTAQVKAAVLQNKVDSTGTVLRAALVSGTTRGAVVLVAVDATVRNVAAPAGRLSHYRIRETLARDGRTGRWLVSELQFVG